MEVPAGSGKHGGVLAHFPSRPLTECLPDVRPQLVLGTTVAPASEFMVQQGGGQTLHVRQWESQGPLEHPDLILS